MFGARQTSHNGPLAPLRRLIGRAMARQLQVLVVPGADTALAAGLDLAAADLCLADGPRQANVLLVVGPLPDGMCDAASIAYAQMPRPRAIIALGSDDIAPLPSPDASEALSQQGLAAAVKTLKQAFGESAFANKIADFDAPALRTRTEYSCPMHPEVISDEPGSCPKCGMFLVPREVQASANDQAKGGGADAPATNEHDHSKHAAHMHNHSAPVAHGAVSSATQYTCPMHPEVVSAEPGNCPKCSMTLEPAVASDAAPATQYTCPMHPEVVSAEPGNCPKCGMTLEPAVASDAAPAMQYTCPMHPEVVSAEPGNCPKCGMPLEPAVASDAAPATQYTCPMHPEVISAEPGNCPKCGMSLEPVAASDAAPAPQTLHSHHAPEAVGDDGIEPGFMSMVELTEGLPRSGDGLQMDWITVPFGPFFPGLPGGLELKFVLDGDTVAEAHVESRVGVGHLLAGGSLCPADFVEVLTAQMRLAPVAYQLLACRAIAAAAGLEIPRDPQRDAALERERIASHLGWLAQMGRQIGLHAIARTARALSLEMRDAGVGQITRLRPRIEAFCQRVRRTPFLMSRLSGIGQLPAGTNWRGSKVAAQDAAGRLEARLQTILRSLEQLATVDDIALPHPRSVGKASGQAQVEIDTPRGLARLSLALEGGLVVSAELDTPSSQHLALVDALTRQQEVADALVAVASLDLSPWEIVP